MLVLSTVLYSSRVSVGEEGKTRGRKINNHRIACKRIEIILKGFNGGGGNVRSFHETRDETATSSHTEDVPIAIYLFIQEIGRFLIKGIFILSVCVIDLRAKNGPHLFRGP